MRENCILAVSNAERAQAYDDRHPDRRKILDQIGFAFHLERKGAEDPIRKKFHPTPIVSRTTPQVKIVENNSTDKTPE